jgi:Protein of unknown function (DUF1579)
VLAFTKSAAKIFAKPMERRIYLKEPVMIAIRIFVLLSLGVCATPSFAASPSELLNAMTGTWQVQQRMWQSAKAEPTSLPAAIAQRKLVQNAYLEEEMLPQPGSAEPFTRRAVFNYNAVTSRYEYASLDTRAPQLMVEQSQPASGSPSSAEIRLQGGSFLAPEWGTARNVRFKYRLTISPIDGNQQTVRLYFTPESGSPKTEFVAFEYIYTKQS